MTELRISVKNEAGDGGTYLTPFFAGFHDGAFDLFEKGQTASAGLEALAEDGNFAPLGAELTAASAGAQTAVAGGAPIRPGQVVSTTVHVNGSLNAYAVLGAMVLPSNDAFVGTADPLKLFSGTGRFLGEQTIRFAGSNVYDAGTEVNSEQASDVPLIGQSSPNTGATEGGVVDLHVGFNGSLGNPGGNQGILGATNAFGEIVDPVAADFTRPDAEIATVHINTVERTEGSDRRDFISGSRSDDIVNAGDGNDLIFGRSGWDVLNGEDGNDRIFGGRGDDEINGGNGRDYLVGGSGDDRIDGGAGRDKLLGGKGDDLLNGGEGRDWISGGSGDDTIGGGTGQDYLFGGRGNDTFVFVAGDGHDHIGDFDRKGDDRLFIDVEGVDDFADLLQLAEEHGHGVSLDFGADGSLYLARTSIESLEESDFLFA